LSEIINKRGHSEKPIIHKWTQIRTQIDTNEHKKERCELTDKSIDNVLKKISLSIPEWKDLISNSFLSKEMKEKYQTLLETRLNILGIQ
jgi:hypothetical protein